MTRITKASTQMITAKTAMTKTGDTAVMKIGVKIEAEVDVEVDVDVKVEVEVEQ